MLNKLLVWLFNKTNGYKTVVGYLTTVITSYVMQKFPDAPLGEMTTVLNYIGGVVFQIGIAHQIVKKF